MSEERKQLIRQQRQLDAMIEGLFPYARQGEDRIWRIDDIFTLSKDQETGYTLINAFGHMARISPPGKLPRVMEFDNCTFEDLRYALENVYKTRLHEVPTPPGM